MPLTTRFARLAVALAPSDDTTRTGHAVMVLSRPRTRNAGAALGVGAP